MSAKEALHSCHPFDRPTEDVVPGTKTESLPEASNYASLLEDARGECCVLWQEYLDPHKGQEQNYHYGQ